MPSTVSWLDYSEEDRRRTLNLIDQFRETDTQDELGIGAVRDAFAELLFPGTSTIQTRARYLLIVPWLFQAMEKEKIPSRRARTWIRNREIRIINALESGGEKGGVIGIVARDKLKRFPSSIYWHGLEVFGIKRFLGSSDEYFRSLDGYIRAQREAPEMEGGGMVDRIPPNWHPSLPKAPDDLFEQTTFALTRKEADYLRERIVIEAPRSMLAHLVGVGRLAPVGFPWLHSAVADFPSYLRGWLDHARNFSEVIHGAPLLYNLMLAEKSSRDDLIAGFSSDLRDWGEQLESRRKAIADWDLTEFWEIVRMGNPRLRPPTQTFLDSWISLATELEFGVAEDKHARGLIEQREKNLKGSQARLENRRALELWNEASGTGRLDYRWPIAQQIVADINRGLKRRDRA